jgi:hypothetical protein
MTGLPAYADGSVSSLRMGKGSKNTRSGFDQFLAMIQQYNSSGERFRIDTLCRSACTMFLSIRNVCIAPGATLAFHTGATVASTQTMLSTYNAALQAYVTANHYMDSHAFHTISGSDIVKRFGYPACR